MFDEQLQESEEDRAAVRENAVSRVRTWKRRSLLAAGALLLSCIAEAPFSKRGPLHDFAEPLGTLLVFSGAHGRFSAS
jgi:hypothetical protein